MKWDRVVFVAGLALVVGVGGGMLTAPGEWFRSKTPEMDYCRDMLRNDAENMAMLRLSGLTKRVEESDATALVCGCATNPVAPTETLRWGFMKSLRSQRLPYCIGHWQAQIEN